jgi:hypothetical protein
MKAEMRKLVIVGVATLVSGVIIACGGNGATNNDQGVSVTFLGLYANLPNNNESPGVHAIPEPSCAANTDSARRR